MKNIFAEVITIGDEILYGQITDTNSQWISAELDKLGIKTIRKSSVGDNSEEILTVLAEAEVRADIILITGGLGPTKDDITKKTLADYFESDMAINEVALAEVTAFFRIRGRELTELNRLQAMQPLKARHISNRVGTAPGMWFEKEGRIFVSMPGVPFEMKEMMSSIILPKLQEHFETPVIYHKIVRTVGIPESTLTVKIEQWEDSLPENIKLAYLPELNIVKLRLTATGNTLEALQKQVDAEIEKLRPLIAKYIYGYGAEELEQVIGRLLLNQDKTIAVAESCTGGYIGHMITRVPGCSAYFSGGMVPYNNEMKINTLGVKQETIERHGAVSEQTVREMAENIRKVCGSSIGVASSGIAGPHGGTDDKPVGTVWIACADEQGTIARRLQLGTERNINIHLTAINVLNMVRKRLSGIETD
jgi:nicotinamide-nucleotide amidase